MKKLILFLFVMAVFGFPPAAFAADSSGVEQYTHPTKDGFSGEKQVDGQLLYYDMGGPTGVAPNYYAGYVRFVAANEGDLLSITFNSFDLTGDVAAVYVYDGDIDYTAYYSSVPEGYLAKYDKDNSAVGQTVTVTSGTMSVLYHCKGNAGGSGWEALVQSVPAKTQEWLRAEASQADLAAAYPNKQGAALIRVNAVTDGGGDAMHLTGLGFELSGNPDLSKLSNLRAVYAASSMDPKGEAFGVTYDAATQTLSFTGDVKLRSGNNYFYLLADIAADAAAGNIYDATLTSMTVAGEEKVSSPIAPEGNVTIANMVLLSSEHATYNVGANPISLYDDGGPEGNIAENFTGSATFVPTTPGKKVAVRFTKLDLFNTSTVGKNDILKVYAGTEADEANLLGEVLKELVTIHSTAADGSLTITLKSTTGIPKPGFEAVIEEFTPVAMTADSFAASHPGISSPAAGQTGVAVLDFTVHTVNTEPALEASAFTFTLTGDAPIANAIVYRKGTSTEKIGELANPSGRFTVTLDSPVTLREGNNIFSLSLDMGEAALTGQTFDVALASATLGGANTEVDAEQGAPAGSFSVENVVYSKNGDAQNVTFSGEWRFANTPSIYSYYGYDATSGTQTTILTPATEGCVAQLDFTKFKVNTSSYSPQTFKILDGDSSTSPVLWEMTTSNNTTGPEKPVRATNEKGALTVLFKSTSNGSMGYGFDAKLTEYQPRTMAVESVGGFTPSEKVVVPDMTDVEVLGVKVITGGTQNPLQLSSMIIDMKGCQDKVLKVKLYAGTSEQFSAEGAVLAEIVPDASAAEQVLTLTEAYTLPEYDSFFFVTYDMKPGLASDISVDAALKSITIGGVNPEITNGDPEGERLTKNIYLLKEGVNTVTVDGSMLFYDNGGADSNYTAKSTGTVTFMPTEGKIIRMHVNSFRSNYNDVLSIYDGDKAEGTALASLKSTSASVTDFLSKADNGALTADWIAKTSSSNEGWEILVEAFVPQPLAIESVEAEPVNDAAMLRGSTGNVMMKVKVNIAGDKGKINIDKLNFSALESDIDAISSAKVYFTGTSDEFSDAELYAEATPMAAMTFEGSRIFDEKGSYYFFLTYDIAAEAAFSADVQVALGSVCAGDVVVEAEGAENALASVEEGIHGTFTVGSSSDCDFATIQAAVTSLASGIDGPVVFEIEDGTYTELVTIPAIKGTSARNTITLKSASGNRDNVVITYNRYDDPGSEFYHLRYGVVTFDGVSYCTLRDLTVTTGTYKGFPGVIFVRNMSRHCTVESCVVSTPSSTDFSSGTNLIQMYSLNEANKNSDYFTLSNSQLDGGYIGMYLQGTAFVALPKQRGGRIVNNTFTGQGSKALYLSCERDAVIQGNTVVSGEDMTNSYYAFDLSGFDGALDVSGNNILMEAPKGSATGIYVRMNSPEKCNDGTRRIYNNEINLRETTTGVTGLRVNTTIPKLEVVGNTINVEPAEGADNSAYGLYVNDVIPSGQITNNLVRNLTSGPALQIGRASYLADSGIPMHTNVYYAPTESAVVYVGGSDDISGAKSFEEWKALGFDTTSYCEMTEFLSPLVLEPAEKGSLLNGTPVEFLTTDLYGAPRDAEHPTIGCYEYAESTSAPEMAEGYPAIQTVGYETAVFTAKPSLTSTLHFMAVAAGEVTPDAATVKTSEQSVDLRKGAEGRFTVTGLEPKTTYRLYSVLTSLRGIDAEMMVSDEFTTTYRPTEIATFENVTEGDEAGMFTDGTQSYTGFEVVAITDGVAPTPNTKAAKLKASVGVVKLTNADNLVIDGVYVKNAATATFIARDEQRQQTLAKSIPAQEDWTYVDLRDLGPFTYLDIECADELMIDNFAGVEQPLEVYIDWNGSRVNEGETVTLNSILLGGVGPFIYRWKNAAGVELGKQVSQEITPEHSGTYYLTVTDARGTTVSARRDILVNGKMVVATFDDLYLDEESQWYAYKEDPDYVGGNFYSGSFAFNNSYMADWDSWSFFGYSNHTSTEFANYVTDQYNSCVGHGADGSANYGVAYISSYMGNTEISLSNTTDAAVVEGIWVTNSAWVVDAILNGDGMEPKFEQNDWLRLTFTGVNTDGTYGNTVDYYLADYRDEDANEHYYVDSWQWVDLKPLGEVSKIQLSMLSTKMNSYGMTTPSYVCIDNVGGECKISEQPTRILLVSDEEPEATLDLSEFFSFDSSEANVVITFEEPCEYATIDGETLKVTAPEGTEFTVKLKAWQRGAAEYLQMPIRVCGKPSGVDGITTEQVSVYPNPASVYFTVSAPSDSFDVSVYSTSGVAVANVAGENGKATVDVSNFAAGTYIVRVADVTSGSTTVHKLIVVH